MRRSLLLILLLSIGACDDVGLGVPGTGTPLPAGGLPASQTLEGGAQIRVSQAGFTKLKSNVPGIVSAELSQGICVPQQTTLGSDVCSTNQGGCTPGCFVAIALPTSGLTISVLNANTVRLQIAATISGFVRIDDPFLPACNASFGATSIPASVDVGFSIDPATGAYEAGLVQINSLLTGVSFTGCASIANRSAILNEFIDSLVSTWITDAITPAVNTAMGGLIPTQTEIAALVDLSALALTGLAASNGSAVETRVLPGGYVRLENNGLSLGIVTGLNSDTDPGTRSAGLVSEPDACVAGLTAPDFSQPPFAFPTTSRGSFSLSSAGAFSGVPADLADDLMVGVSRSALNLAGHHMVASGGMCLTIDASLATFVRRDVLDDLLGIPLAAADEALRFVVRPQQPIRFNLGTGTVLLPHLRADLDDLEIDVETLPGGPAIPALRLTADVAISSQLGTRRDTGLPTRLESTRSGLSVANPAVQVFDARYAGVNAADLGVLAGTIADVVFSTIGAGAGTVLVSDFAGFSLYNVVVQRVTTASDDFLAVTASLALNPLAGNPPAPTPQPLSTSLVLPTPAALRLALLAGNSAGLPTLHVELATADGSARPLEHSWRTAGGVWRPYEATSDLVIRDRSFAWQGERTIELRSRVVGDDSTTSPVGSTTVVIDYAPPTIFIDQVTLSSHFTVPARDSLSATLEWAMGPVGETTPTTAWTSGRNLNAAAALAFGDAVIVYVRDDVGNVAQSPAIPLPEPDLASATGIGCAVLAFMSRRARRTRLDQHSTSA